MPGAKPTPLAHQQLDKSQGQLKSKWTEEGEEVLVEELEGEEEGEQEESPVRKQSMFKDIFEEPKEPEERKIEVFSKASKIPPKSSGVGLAEMMKSRLNRGDKVDSDKEVLVEEVRRRSGERSSSEARSRSRSQSWKRGRSRSRENKKKSKNKKNKSRSRSKAKKKKKYRSSSSSASSPEKRKKKKKKHKVKREEAESSRSRSGSREEKKKKKKKDRSRSKSTKGKKRKRSQSRSRSPETKFKKKRFRKRSRSKSYESEGHLKVIPVQRRSISRSMSRGPVSRSMSREVVSRRSESQSQDAWRKIEGRGREEDYLSRSQSRRNSESRDLDSRRSVSKEKLETADRRSISRGFSTRSIASKSRERSQLERIQESSEEEVQAKTCCVCILILFNFVSFRKRTRRQLWQKGDLRG